MPRGPRYGRLEHRVSVEGAKGQLVAGRTRNEPKIRKFAITVEEQIIGHVLLSPGMREHGVLELALRDRTIKTLYLVALLVFAISVLVALLFSRQILRPIKAITVAAKKLAGGDYDAEVSRYANDELGQLSDDFNTLAKTLKSNLKSRQQWIADISHELRTPLSILQGELEAMQDGVRPINKDRIASLQEESSRLNKLVNDLYVLSLSDLGALSYHKQRINLTVLLRQS